MKSDTLISTGSGLLGGMITSGHTDNFLQSCLFSAVFAAIGYLTKLGMDQLVKKIAKSKKKISRIKKRK